LVCRGCHRLGPLSLFLSTTPGTKTLKLKCQVCKQGVFPARLIVACSRGHIDDFPWKWWAHGKEPVCASPELYLTASGRTASLSDLRVSCRRCNTGQSLGGAFGSGALASLPCQGNRPWLRDQESGCQEELHTLQRGASNVYFSVTESGLSIPPWSSNLQSALDKHWGTLKHVPDESLWVTVQDMGLARHLRQSVDQIVEAIKSRRAASTGQGTTLTREQLRDREYQALKFSDMNLDKSDDFEVRDEPVAEPLQTVIGTVRRAERLREVRALRGFTRVDPPGIEEQVRLAPLSATPGGKDWLPAVELRGEGIFIELDPERVALWEKAATIQQRAGRINRQYAHMCDDHQISVDREISPRFLLIHTFAHTLIRQFSLICGYSSAALRERLYVTEASDRENGAAAALIYTATTDSDGSLGGLVRQARPEQLYSLIMGALEDAIWCSSDPLCIESQGQGYEALNLAACHSCVLLPETSCEHFNRLLDRAMIVGTGDESCGFFSSLIQEQRLAAMGMRE
ncbi:MAG: DrmB family protein, partial [Ktedonobacterales bacterium]